jgi:hypothetical protein
LLDWKEFHDFANVTLEVPISYINADLQRSLELQSSNPVKSSKRSQLQTPTGNHQMRILQLCILLTEGVPKSIPEQ